MNNIDMYKEKTFDDIKHIDEFGNEYWEAREIIHVLGYAKWGNFKKVIDKAKISCKVSGNRIEDCFADVGKPITSGKGKIEFIEDYKLSRYACYLVVQNADPRKKAVALGQTYFAIQTRKMEITEEEYTKLSEDERRLYNRMSASNKNKTLFYQAKKSGVENFGKFNNFGYQGLYNGETAKQIANRKGIDYDKEDILDWMGSAELAANIFRITQTEEKLKNDHVSTETDACSTHYVVGKTVREAIEKLGGTMPEKLPTPDKSIRELEKEEIKKITSKE